MEFCDFCENLVCLRSETEINNSLMTPKAENSNNLFMNQHRLVYYCEHCDISKTPDANRKHVHYRASVNRDNNFFFSQMINKYTKYDITYPRTKMHCPCCSGDDHSSNDQDARLPEVIFISYDTSKMKYLFQCTECGYGWRNTMQMDKIVQTEIL